MSIAVDGDRAVATAPSGSGRHVNLPLKATLPPPAVLDERTVAGRKRVQQQLLRAVAQCCVQPEELAAQHGPRP